MQERCNSSASAMELRLSCINPSIWSQRFKINSLKKKVNHQTFGINSCNLYHQKATVLVWLSSEIFICLWWKLQVMFVTWLTGKKWYHLSHICHKENLVQACCISIAGVLEILQSCTEPLREFHLILAELTRDLTHYGLVPILTFKLQVVWWFDVLRYSYSI